MEEGRPLERASGDTASDTSATSRAPKLVHRVRAAIRVRHYSRRTEEAYIHWIRRYIVFSGKRHPSELGGGEVTAFHRSASSCQATGARPGRFEYGRSAAGIATATRCVLA